MYRPAVVSSGEYTEKGSSFLSFLYPADSVEEVETFRTHLAKTYYDARHLCYAYKIGNLTRENDDGEPRHSAGSPILRAMTAADLTCAVCFVVRYFGGTKLGVPGLIRAYGTAAKEAIAKNVLVEYFETVCVRIEFDYAQTNFVKYRISKNNLTIKESFFGESCCYILVLKSSDEPAMRLHFADVIRLWEII